MKVTKSQKIIFSVLGACLIASILNIGAMITVSKILGPKLSITTIYFAILPGTLIGSFLLGFWMKSKGWLWGLVVPLVSMVMASIFHSDRVNTTILIYVLQLIPASLIGELGSRILSTLNSKPKTRN